MTKLEESKAESEICAFPLVFTARVGIDRRANQVQEVFSKCR